MSYQGERSQGAARAYLVDGENGTRSGPVRHAGETEKLQRDLEHLRDNATSDFTESGVARPGHKFWTNLPQDSVFNARQL